MMYRPQSQIHRQRSNDIRDLQSRSKKASDSRHKQHGKKTVDNLDSQRQKRLKLDSSVPNSKNQLKEKIEKRLYNNNGSTRNYLPSTIHDQRQPQMLRYGLVRFLSPKLSQQDFSRFKKLLELSNKIQRLSYEIVALQSMSPKYVKESVGNGALQQMRLRELTEEMRRLQLEEERILDMVEEERKENVRGRGERRFGELKQVENQAVDHNSDSRHIKSSQKHNKQLENHITSSQRPYTPSQQSPHQLPQAKHQPFTTPTVQHLQHLYSLISQLDSKHFYFFVPNLNDKSSSMESVCSSQKMYEEIHSFIAKRQKEMEKVHGELSEILGRVRGNIVEENKERKENASRVINQQGTRLFGRIHALHQQQLTSTKPNNLIDNSTINKSPHHRHLTNKPTFTQLISKLSQQLKQIPQLKQRSSEFAKTIMNLSREVQLQKDQKLGLQRKIKAKDQRSGEMVDMMKRENAIVREKVRVLQGQIKELRVGLEGKDREIAEKDRVIAEKQRELRQKQRELRQRDGMIQQQQRQMQQKEHIIQQNRQLSLQLNQQLLLTSKQLLQIKQQYQQKCTIQTKTQHYFRQNLTLQQQITILSQQNQKLLTQLNQVRQLHQQNKTIKQQQVTREQEIKNSQKQKPVEPSKANNDKSSVGKMNASQGGQQQSSLIYRQLQKKNRKLLEELGVLREQVGECARERAVLQDKINEGQRQLQQIRRQMQEVHKDKTNITTQLHSTQQQLQSTKQQLQSTTHQLQSTKTQLQTLQQAYLVTPPHPNLQLTQLQEQFQLLVKQKLQLQSELLSTKSQCKRITVGFEQFVEDMVARMMEISELVSGVKEDKEYLVQQIERLRQVVGDGFEGIGKGLVQAVEQYINNIRGLQQQQGTNRAQIIQQQQQLAHITQPLQPPRPSPSHPQHQHLLAQHHLLLTQFNHLIFQLNSFRQLYTQLQIQKELRQKYYEEDMIKLKGEVMRLQRENEGMRYKGNEETRRGEGKDVGCQASAQYQEGEQRHIKQRLLYTGLDYAQQTICPLKRITSNLYNMFIGSEAPKSIDHNQQTQTDPEPTRPLTLSPCVLSLTHTPSPLLPQLNLYSCLYNIMHSPAKPPTQIQEPQQNTKLKLNSDLLSVQIHYNIQQYKQNDQLHKQMTFQQWIDMVNIREQDNSEGFRLFCITQLAQNKEQMQVHNDEREMVTNYNSLMKDQGINSPGEKSIAVIQNNREQPHSSTRLNLMGSLYNRFTFPKLAQQPNNRLNQPPANHPQPAQPHHAQQHQCYPPLQLLTIKPLPNLKPPTRLKTQPPTTSFPKLYPQPQIQDDQSFDLCII